jgi:maltose-binding protein MalE
MKPQRLLVRTVATALITLPAILVSQGGVPAAHAAVSPATITLWDFFPPSPSPERQTLLNVAKQWAKATGNSVVDPGQVANAVTKFQTAAPAGQGPDIIMQPQDQEGALATAGLLAPVPASLRAAAQLAQFAPVSIKALTYKGQLYGLPFAQEAVGIYYNKKLLPSVPATWTALIPLAQKLTHGDQYGFLWDTTNFYYDYDFIAGFGGYLFKSTSSGYDPSAIGLATPGGVQGFAFIHDLVQKYHLTPATTNTDVMEAKFSAGKAAMIIDGPWAVPSFKHASLDFGFALLPTLPNGKPMRPLVGVQGLYVNSHGTHVEAAWSLVNYLVQHMQGPLFTAGGRIPVLKSVANSPLVQQDAITQTVLRSAALGSPMPNVPAMSTVWTPMASALTLVVSGKATPDVAAKDAVTKIQQAIAAQQG